MNIPDQIVFSEYINRDGSYILIRLCFKHAVVRAINNEDITIELREESQSCHDCETERMKPKPPSVRPPIGKSIKKSV